MGIFYFNPFLQLFSSLEKMRYVVSNMFVATHACGNPLQSPQTGIGKIGQLFSIHGHIQVRQLSGADFSPVKLIPYISKSKEDWGS